MTVPPGGGLVGGNAAWAPLEPESNVAARRCYEKVGMSPVADFLLARRARSGAV